MIPIEAHVECLEKELARLQSTLSTLSTLTAERDGLRELCAALVDEGDCRYDHHDLCQEHGLFQKPCPHEQAKQLLKAKRDSQ